MEPIEPADEATAATVASIPTIVRTIVPPETRLPRAEAKTILQIAFLAAEIDLKEDRAERPVLDALNQHVWPLAGLPPQPVPPVSPLPLPSDREARIACIKQLAAQVATPVARELAYVGAYVMTVADHEAAPVEDALLVELRRALQLDDNRAGELAATAAVLMTPGAAEEVAESAARDRPRR